MSLLELDGVKKRFAGVHAVDGVSLKFASGEFIALIGPNGAGKTTLFATIAGQYAPDAGSIAFDGQAIGRLPPARLAALGIGRTFQTAHVFDSMTVLENVQLPLATHRGAQFDFFHSLWRGDHRSAQALLARVGLGDRANQAAESLGYGDVKRLELAIALAGSPRLLLMDEPTAGMALGERLALMDLVRDIARETGLTLLFTEHSMEVVFGYARRVIVMSAGRVIADGAPQAVRDDAAAQAAYFGDEA
jgi:ABC-type branched-subunit amino acid transport system ATPase component